MSQQQEFAIVKDVPAKLSNPTPMDLLSVAINNNSAIDVIERLAALQEKAMARDAEMQFNEAMNKAQEEIPRIVPNLENTQTHSKYATYATLDRAIRPVYVKHLFSLSFNTEDSPKAEHVRVVCYCSHKGGHTRKYQVDMPADGKGAKGADVMTKTHATGAAMSYGMRYLLKYIFNIAIGEDDTDGNLTQGWLDEKLDWIASASASELEGIFKDAYAQARKENATQASLKSLITAKDKRKKELGL